MTTEREGGWGEGGGRGNERTNDSFIKERGRERGEGGKERREREGGCGRERDRKDVCVGGGGGERLREDEREVGGREGEREVVFQLFGNLQVNLKEAKLSARVDFLC